MGDSVATVPSEVEEDRIFLIEVYVNKIAFKNLDAPPQKKQIVLDVILGQLADFEIRGDLTRTELLKKQDKVPKSNIDFKSGKSCLFLCKPSRLTKILSETPLKIKVKQKAQCISIGVIAVYFDEKFVETVTKFVEEDNFQPVTIKDELLIIQDSCQCEDIEKCRCEDIASEIIEDACEDEAILVDAAQENEPVPVDDTSHSAQETVIETFPTFGTAEVLVSVTALGRQVLTDFEVQTTVSNENKYFFKNISGTTVVCQKYGFGVGKEVVPIAPIFGAVGSADINKYDNAPCIKNELTAEVLSKALCNNPDCPGVQKFKKFGIGPLAVKNEGLGTVCGDADPPLNYGLSQMYGTMDYYGPYGFYRRPKRLDEPFIGRKADLDKQEGSVDSDDSSLTSCSCNSDPLRLRGGGPTNEEEQFPTPSLACKELMADFDNLLVAYKNALGPCGQATCPFAPNVTIDQCQKMCNEEEQPPVNDKDAMSACGSTSCPHQRQPFLPVEKSFQSSQIKAACGSPRCPYTREKIGMGDDFDQMNKMCGPPKCPFPLNNLPPLEPIHWDCPDPLPKGLCKNPECPLLPRELKCYRPPKGPCGSTACPFAPPTTCDSKYCPFNQPPPLCSPIPKKTCSNKDCPFNQPPPPCPFSATEDCPFDKGSCPPNSNVDSCPIPSRSIPENMNQNSCPLGNPCPISPVKTTPGIQNSPYPLSCPLYPDGSCPIEIRICPPLLGPMNMMCDFPGCPLSIQPAPCGVEPLPTYPKPAAGDSTCKRNRYDEVQESCGVDDCPYMPPPKALPETCGNPDCPYAPEPVHEICENPDCPFAPRTADDDSCSNPDCPAYVPKADKCWSPVCPFAVAKKPSALKICPSVTQETKMTTKLESHSANENGKNNGENGGRSSQSAPVISAVPNKEPPGTQSEKTINRKVNMAKKSKKYVYTLGDKYPGIHVGHKECNIPGPKIPPDMGWAWNVFTPCLSLKPRRGWKPGALTRSLAKRIKEHREAKGIAMNQDLTAKSSRRLRRYETQSDITVAPKPTLQIQKKDGCYLITMNPLKDPKTLAHNENPYMDCTPMQFKIVKNRKDIDYKTCYCGQELDEDDICDNISSSSDSELDIEFTPPAGIIRPERLKKDKHVVHCESQYNPVDFESTKKKDKKGKKGKKDKKGKGKKGKGKKGKGKKKK